MPAKSSRPAIFLSARDADRLRVLARRSASHDPAARLLSEEVARAHICSPDDMPARIVRLGSRVRYREQGTGAEAEVRLCMPEDAGSERGCVSVLDMTGAALIGLPQDQRFGWTEGDGQVREIQVLEVLDDFLWR